MHGQSGIILSVPGRKVYFAVVTIQNRGARDNSD